MTYFDYICARFDEESNKKKGRDPTWDLAHDARKDLLYPRESNDRQFIRNYLISQKACGACMTCFEKAFDLYEKLDDAEVE